MGIRNIVWKARAKQNHIKIALWYRDNVEMLAAQHYLQGMDETIRVLAQIPTIGKISKLLSNEKYTYWEFVAHPKYIITYRFTSRTLYIVGIRSTLMLN